jgi:DNA gyrase subunit A
MTDENTPSNPEAGDIAMRIEPVGLETEMQRSYLDYAMSVIVSRALPDVRDGLKPVHRRVLYAMYDGGYRPEKGFYKCARVVGDVMGTYHPHGDSSIYASRSPGRCGCRWWTPTATSALPATTRPPPCGTPSAS